MWAGWASTSITPDRPVALNGQMYTRISQSVHDPVTATALAVESRGAEADQAIMISCDLVGIQGGLQEAVRAKLKDRLSGFDLKKLFLNATHTHTAPAMLEGRYEVPRDGILQPAEYFSFLTDALAGIAAQAWRNRKPAGVSWSYSHAVVGHNRRAVYASGRAQMYGKTDRPDFVHVEGTEDHGVDLLFFWDEASKLTGIVIDLACPSQVRERESYISADFWDDVRKELRKRYSAGLFVYPITGVAGDQSPHFIFGERAEVRLRERRGVSETEEIARRIASAVDIAFAGAGKDIRTNLPMRHLVADIRLPLHPISQKQFEAARAQWEKALKAAPHPNRYYTVQRQKEIMDRYEAQAKAPAYPAEVHVLRLGDIALATNPFEMFLDYGIRIKARSPAEQTFLAQLACDYGMYLPTARAVEGGGYSAELASFQVGPEGGQMLVEATVKLLESLWPR